MPLDALLPRGRHHEEGQDAPPGAGRGNRERPRAAWLSVRGARGALQLLQRADPAQGGVVVCGDSVERAYQVPASKAQGRINSRKAGTRT